MSIPPVEVSWFAALCDDDYEFLGVPEAKLQSSFGHCSEIVRRAEGIELTFTPGAVEAIAEYAFEANTRAENIGARRLHTIMETLLDDLSFKASELTETEVTMDEDAVRKILGPVLEDEDLSRYIL